MHSIHQCTWKSLQFFIMIMMACGIMTIMMVWRVGVKTLHTIHKKQNCSNCSRLNYFFFPLEFWNCFNTHTHFGQFPYFFKVFKAAFTIQYFFNKKWLQICLTWHSSNEMLCLSFKQHRRGRVADAFMSTVPMVYGFALTLVTFVLVVVVTCFNSWDQFFFTFSKSFQTFLFRFTL